MADIVTVLEAAKRYGFLGPGPVEAHIAHARRFADVIGVAPERAIDLGSGAGVPGLVLALSFPDTRWVLLDSAARRAAFAGDAVRELGLSGRAEVVCRRAESIGRDEAFRGRFGLAVARGFGPPAVVAECGAPLLEVGGRLVVSEPPDGVPRWPDAGVAVLGLTVGPRDRGCQLLVQSSPCPARFPRRAGVPARRPLF